MSKRIALSLFMKFLHRSWIRFILKWRENPISFFFQHNNRLRSNDGREERSIRIPQLKVPCVRIVNWKIQIQSVIFLACNYFHIIYRVHGTEENVAEFMPYFRVMLLDSLKKNVYFWDQLNNWEWSLRVRFEWQSSKSSLLVALFI